MASGSQPVLSELNSVDGIQSDERISWIVASLKQHDLVTLCCCDAIMPAYTGAFNNQRKLHGYDWAEGRL